MTFLLIAAAAAESVPVDCDWSEGQPWCTASVQIDAPLTRVDAVLADYANHPTVFPRIKTSTALGDETIHVVLEMPFPLAPRDYVAKFVRQERAGEVTLQWSAVEHPAAPQSRECVRLFNTAGTWTLRALSEGRTEVRYYWNADLGGDVPDWALPRAWQMQGDEVLGRLKAAAE